MMARGSLRVRRQTAAGPLPLPSELPKFAFHSCEFFRRAVGFAPYDVVGRVHDTVHVEIARHPGGVHRSQNVP